MYKIVIITNSAWQAYNFRLELARSLKAKGSQVIFFFPFDGKYEKNITNEFTAIDINLIADSMNPLFELKTLFSIYHNLKRIKPHIVLSFTIKPNIYGSISSNILGIKNIANITGLGTIFIKGSMLEKIVRILYKISLKKTNYVFFQNTNDMHEFINSNLASEDRSVLTPGSGVNTNKFSQDYTNHENRFKFVMVSRVIKDKGVIEFIKASKIILDKYPEVSFELVGEIDVKNVTSISTEYIIKTNDSGVVKYKGMVNDIYKELLFADCVVLPSYREGCPRSILEASSMGIPVIVSDVVGCRDVVDDNITGFYCNKKDSVDLAIKMEKILNLNFEERRVMGLNGRKKMCKEYSEGLVINKYLEKIESIV